MIPLQRSGVLPDGTYKLVVTESEKKPGKSGYDFIVITCTVFENGKPGDNQVWDNLSLSPKSKWTISSFLDAIQAPTEGQMHYKNFKGKTFYATLTHEVYKGRLKNTIDTFLTPEQAGHGEDVGSSTEDYLAPVEDDDEDPSGPKPFSWSGEDTDEEDTSVVNQMPEELAEEDIPF